MDDKPKIITRHDPWKINQGEPIGTDKVECANLSDDLMLHPDERGLFWVKISDKYGQTRIRSYLPAVMKGFEAVQEKYSFETWFEMVTEYQDVVVLHSPLLEENFNVDLYNETKSHLKNTLK